MGGMRSPSPRAILTVLLAGQFMANVDNAIVNLATPSIGATLHASGAELQLTVAAYVLASAMLLVTAARLGDHWGRRRLFLAGLAGFTAASLICGLASGPLTLIVARFVQGIGSAFMVAQVLSGIQREFEGPARTRALGAYTVTLSASAVIGQLLGGALVSANLFGTAWRPIFLINVPIGIALGAFALRTMPADGDRIGARRDLDPFGVAAFAAAMLLAVVPLTLGRELGWPIWTQLALGASILAGVAFVRRERALAAAGGAPLLNLKLFASPAIAWGLGALLGTRMAYLSLLFVVALYLQQGHGASALTSGLAMVSWVAAYGIAGPVFPRFPARIAGACGPFGCLLMALSFAALSVAAFGGVAHGVALVVPLGFGGFGFGISSIALMSQITRGVAPAYAPDLSGILATMIPLAATFGVATFGSAYLTIAPHGGGGAANQAFGIVCAAFAATTLCAAFAAACAGVVSASISRASTR